MASYQDRKELQNCPVCLELFKQPRKLPICKHVFCESCIIDTIGKLRTRGDEDGNENENESGFPCPLCRVVNQFPGKTEDLQTWVSTLEMDEQTSDVKIENMEDCMPCKKLNKSTRAVKYCLDCRESLCAQCFEETQKFKVFLGHIVVEINDNRDTSDNPLISDLNEVLLEHLACTQHPDKNVAFICEDEDELCCQNCILTKHRKCSKVIALQDISKEDSEKEIRKLTGSLNDLTHCCQGIIEAIKVNETESKTSAELIRQTITYMRTKVNQLFDVLKESVSQECKANMKKASISNEPVLQEVEDIIGKLKISSALLENRQFEGSLQYALFRRLQRRFYDIETKTVQLVLGLKKFGFELKVEEPLKDFLEVDINQTEKLASVRETEDKLTVQNPIGCKQLEYDIAKIGTFDVRTENYPIYSDLVYDNANRIILTDYMHGYGCLINDAFRRCSLCKFTTFNTEGGEDSDKDPSSVTIVQNGILIVSQPKRTKLFAVKVVDKLEILLELESPYKAKAVRALSNGDLAVSWLEPVAFGIVSISFYKLEEKTYFDRDASGRVFKTFDYMAVDQKTSHIIQPCIVDKAVYCFDIHGNPIFEYQHDELEQPSGVGIDARGNVYVCDTARGNIHIMSSTGIPIRVFRERLPEKPLAICFNNDKSRFAVTCSFGCSSIRKRCELHIFQLK